MDTKSATISNVPHKRCRASEARNVKAPKTEDAEDVSCARNAATGGSHGLLSDEDDLTPSGAASTTTPPSTRGDVHAIAADQSLAAPTPSSTDHRSSPPASPAHQVHCVLAPLLIPRDLALAPLKNGLLPTFTATVKVDGLDDPSLSDIGPSGVGGCPTSPVPSPSQSSPPSPSSPPPSSMPQDFPPPEVQEQPYRPNYFRSPPVPCQWGGVCGIGLDDVSPGGILRHLREYHPEEKLDKQTRGRCLWSTGHDALCERPMMQSNYGKHIAEIHVRSMAVECPSCRKSFSRPDVLEKHRNGRCKGSA
ncbi:hypothetical protein BKA93DRAFT_826754 [Sparassis latifolia]